MTVRSHPGEGGACMIDIKKFIEWVGNFNQDWDPWFLEGAHLVHWMLHLCLYVRLDKKVFQVCSDVSSALTH